MKTILFSILLFFTCVNFSLAQTYVLTCMSEDIFINEEKKRLSAQHPTTNNPPRFYSFELINDKINYFMPFFRNDDGFPTIWKMSIDLINMKRSFTVRKIPDDEMNTIYDLYKKAKINLGWSPKVTFKQLISEMLQEKISKN